MADLQAACGEGFNEGMKSYFESAKQAPPDAGWGWPFSMLTNGGNQEKEPDEEEMVDE